ncbi:MAG: hypothetical protein KAU31_12790, partial [Spirochaetaceae bacterium]|nr:hypothetical protein [Spirochaetaceae bacterium]
ADAITSIVLDGHYVYASLSAGGIIKFDIAQSGTPVIVDQSSSEYGGYCHLVVQDDRLYASGDELHVLDKNDFSLITTVPGLSGSIEAGVSVAIFDASKIVGFDPDAPNYLTVLGTISLGNWVQDMEIDGDTLYVTDYIVGLLKVDIDPASPTFRDVNLVTNLATPLGVAVKGDLAFVGDKHNGLRVIDIDPDSGTYGNVLQTLDPGTVRWVTIHGDYAYIDDYLYTLYVVDISNPLAPSVVTSHSIFNYVSSIQANNRYLCVTDNYSLKVFDIANPTTLDEVGDVPLSSPYRMAVHGGNLYVNSAGMQIRSLADPVALALVGSYSSYDAIDFIGDVAFSIPPLESINISDPTNPTLLGSAEGVGADSIYVSNGYAYLASPDPGEDEPHGLYVYDVTDPENPTFVVFLNGLDGRAVRGYGDMVCLASDSGMFYVFNVSNPSNPVELGSAALGVGEGLLIVQEQYAFFNGFSHVVAIDIDPDSAAFMTVVDSYPGLMSFGFDISGSYLFRVYAESCG